MSFDGSNWMSASAEKLKGGSLKFKDFLLIGSHDAGINKKDAKKKGIAGSLLSLKLSVTQSVNVLGQLNSGARWFDVRLDKQGSDILTYHATMDQGAWGQSFSSILDNCLSFLEANPSEFICLKVTHTKERIIDEVYSMMRKKGADAKEKYYSSRRNQNNIMEESYDKLKGKLLIFTDKKIIDTFDFTPIKILKLKGDEKALGETLPTWSYIILEGKYSDSKSGSTISAGQMKNLSKALRQCSVGTASNLATCVQLYWTATGGYVVSHADKLFESVGDRPYLTQLQALLKPQAIRPKIVNIDFVNSDKCEIIYKAVYNRV